MIDLANSKQTSGNFIRNDKNMSNGNKSSSMKNPKIKVISIHHLFRY